MKASIAAAIFTSVVSVSAHSGVWNLEVDGVMYVCPEGAEVPPR